jgi:hypothetical protein
MVRGPRAGEGAGKAKRRGSAFSFTHCLSPAGRHPVDGGTQKEDFIRRVGARDPASRDTRDISRLDLALAKVEPLKQQADLRRVREFVDRAEAQAVLLVDRKG